jgi:BCD family chlorophyll transporter-like MFS transporter
LVAAGLVGPGWPLRASVFALGVANGAFAIAAIGSMMALAGAGREAREGVRMGLWGAAQAVAFALGGFAGTVAVDLARLVVASPAMAYASVFAGQAILFLVSAGLAARVERPSAERGPVPASTAGGACAAGLGGR